MSNCPSISDAAFLSSTLTNIDCQAQTIGEQGYLALAGTGSSVQLALGSALTLFVALWGFRLMVGRSPTFRDLIISAIKIGLVLTLASSWPAFRTLVYDVTLKAPGEIASSVAASSGLASATDLVGQLQALDVGMAELALLGAGQPPNVTGVSATGTAIDQMRSDAGVAPQRLQPLWDPARDLGLLSSARTVFLTATLAGVASTRLVAGLALALGPLFAILLLFESTRSFVEGWVRVLVGAALAAVAVSIILAVEIAIVGPWLTGVLETRYQNISTPAAPVQLLVLSLVFALALLASIIASGRLALAFRIAHSVDQLGVSMAQQLPALGQATAERRTTLLAAGDERSRALVIADAIANSKRRELTDGRRIISAGGRTQTPRATSSGELVDTSLPLGQRSGLRTQRRVSAGVQRRDRAR